jgi:hypothetical protein
MRAGEPRELHGRRRRVIVPCMADKPYSDQELKALRSSPGWQLDAGDVSHEGTLEDVAKIAHERRARGEHPGVIRQIETSIELEMLQLESLWYALGLPR